MSTLVLQGETRLSGIDPADRGFAYGDGLFETMRVHAGLPVWWDAHWARLESGAARLGFAAPDPSSVRAHATALLAGAPPQAVLKLIVSRGAGGRGYAPPACAVPTVVMSVHEAPADPGPVQLRWCDLRWALQPRLAGIKHLNRLEQVLARAEWTDPAIFEGLVCDADGKVVSATSANLFVRLGHEWVTPPVECCGIAGLMREWILRHQPGAHVGVVSTADVLAADEVLLCNAVRGILPVRRLDQREWPTWPAARALRRRLASAEPAFAFGEN